MDEQELNESLNKVTILKGRHPACIFSHIQIVLKEKCGSQSVKMLKYVFVLIVTVVLNNGVVLTCKSHRSKCLKDEEK